MLNSKEVNAFKVQHSQLQRITYRHWQPLLLSSLYGCAVLFTCKRDHLLRAWTQPNSWQASNSGLISLMAFAGLTLLTDYCLLRSSPFHATPLSLPYRKIPSVVHQQRVRNDLLLGIYFLTFSALTMSWLHDELYMSKPHALLAPYFAIGAGISLLKQLPDSIRRTWQQTQLSRQKEQLAQDCKQHLPYRKVQICTTPGTQEIYAKVQLALTIKSKEFPRWIRAIRQANGMAFHLSHIATLCITKAPNWAKFSAPSHSASPSKNTKKKHSAKQVLDRRKPAVPEISSVQPASPPDPTPPEQLTEKSKPSSKRKRHQHDSPPRVSSTHEESRTEEPAAPKTITWTLADGRKIHYKVGETDSEQFAQPYQHPNFAPFTLFVVVLISQRRMSDGAEPILNICSALSHNPLAYRNKCKLVTSREKQTDRVYGGDFLPTLKVRPSGNDGKHRGYGKEIAVTEDSKHHLYGIIGYNTH